MKVSIIGAGPTGSFSAYLLAKAGFDVTIYENHSEIGVPVQCSGLVTKTIRNIDEVFHSNEFEKVIANKINLVRLFSPNDSCEISLKSADLILHRARLDKWLASLAENAGAKIELNSKFLKFEKENGKIIAHIKQDKQNGSLAKVKSDILIGADGFFSAVSKQLGNKREFVNCVQANYEYASEPGIMDIFFSEKYSGLFAWIVPKNAFVAEIGLGCRENPAEKFAEFLQEHKIKSKALEHTGGPITYYSPNSKFSDSKVFLVGEAAALVKASTLGGIIPSLNSAKALASSIVDGKNGSYESELSGVMKEMKAHNFIRRLLDKFSDAEYDALLRLCNSERVKALLAEQSRDSYAEGNFKLKLLFAQPRFLKFLF